MRTYRPYRISLVLCALSLGLLSACGGGGGDKNDTSRNSGSVNLDTSNTQASASNDYFPLGASDRWVYEETSDGKTSTYQVDVGVTNTVNGQRSTSLVPTTLSGLPRDEVTPYVTTASSVTELPSEGDAFMTSLGPHILFQLPAQAGDSFVQINKTIDYGTDLDGDGVNERALWLSTVQVISNGPLTIPAGDFKGAMHIRTTVHETLIYSATGNQQPYQFVVDDWYVAHVGLVRSDVTSMTAGQPQLLSSTVLLAYRAGNAHGGVAPTVSVVAPADAKVHTGAVAVTAAFSVQMDAASLNAGGFTVVDAANNPVSGTVTLSQDKTSATFVPTASWSSGQYTAIISTLATDRQGNAAIPRSWTFVLDTVAPALAQAAPVDGTVGLATDAKLNYVFSEPLDPISVMPGGVPAFTIKDDATGEAAPVLASFDGTAAISFTPRTYWPHGHTYTVTFPASMADSVGNTLGTDIKVHFSTSTGLFSNPEPVASSLGQQPTMSIGDIDGDGLPDLIWAAWDDSGFPLKMRIFVRRGQADGSLSAAVEATSPLTSLCGLYAIAIGDVNGDGRNDLVLGGSCGIRVLLQDASGSFTTGPLYSLPGYDYAGVVKLVDLNGDGRLDMLTAGNGSAFRVWTQTSAGAFVQTATVETGLGALTGLELADLDGDGIVDVVASSIGSQDSRLAVLHGLTGGGFGAPSVLPTGDGWATGAAIGDLDGDGRLDIFVAIPPGLIGTTASRVVVFRQASDHSFAAATTIPVASSPRGISLIDVTGDGRLDLVVAHENALGVLPRLADGSFGAEDLYGVPQLSSSTTSIAFGPRDAQGRALIEFNGVLFRPNAASLASNHLGAVRRAAQLLGRASVQSKASR